MNNYENEIWRTVKDYPDYEVSNMGRIRSFKNYKEGKLLCPKDNKYGYLVVVLTNKNGQKTKKLHRLIAETFVPNPENKPQVDHINRNRSDNRVENLRWVNQAENENNKDKSYHAKNKGKRRNYCIELNKVFESCSAAAREIHCDGSLVRQVLDGKIYTAKGYHFISYDEYLDMLTTQLLEIAFLDNEEEETDGSELVSICGVPLNDYLAMNEAI